VSAIPEEVLRALLDAVPDATLAADASGRVVFANQSAASLFGYRPQELIGIAIASLVPEVSPRVGVRRDGSTFRALIDGERPEETPGFALFRVRESKPDVRLEDVLSELRISEERIRFILDSLPGMVFVADTTGGNTFTNRNFQTYTGLSEEKLLAHGWMDVLHPDDRARAARTWYACVRTGNAYEAEYRYRRHDGAYRWHLCRGLPLRDAAGKVTAWYGVCADIEDYKRAEFDSRTIHHSLEEIARERTAQLRQSEERYRTLISGIKDYAILMLDREGHVASWNECAQRTKGYSAEEILGKDFACFYTPEDIARDHPREMLRSAARDGHYEEDGWRVRKDGSRFWANVSLTAMRSATGELTGFSKVTRDITDRLLAEERLKAERQRAEDANRSKSDFLAAMSHEIRTPMNAILGMSDLLWESDLSEEQRKYVEVFRRAGSNLLILINDILDLSKIESGHFELEKAPFDLTEVVDQVIELLRPRARKKGIAMSAEIVPGTQTALIGDATRLRQVLTNLLGNAVKFTETGEVRLEVRAASAEPGDLDFMVSDTGIGIAPDKLEVIFQDFTQADSSTTRHYGGTGLGLSISRRIVNLMGGTLQAASTLGKGSTFRFRARLMVNPAEKSVEPQGITDIHGRRALVVDDSATNRLILHEGRSCRSAARSGPVRPGDSRPQHAGDGRLPGRGRIPSGGGDTNRDADVGDGARRFRALAPGRTVGIWRETGQARRTAPHRVPGDEARGAAGRVRARGPHREELGHGQTAATSGRRGFPRQPAPGEGVSERQPSSPDVRRRRQSRRRTIRRRKVRLDPDGYPDARDGRVGGHQDDPRQGSGEWEPSRADHCIDRARDPESHRDQPRSRVRHAHHQAHFEAQAIGGDSTVRTPRGGTAAHQYSNAGGDRNAGTAVPRRAACRGGRHPSHAGGIGFRAHRLAGAQHQGDRTFLRVCRPDANRPRSGAGCQGGRSRHAQKQRHRIERLPEPRRTGADARPGGISPWRGHSCLAAPTLVPAFRRRATIRRSCPALAARRRFPGSPAAL